jgi:hypothetical protein
MESLELLDPNRIKTIALKFKAMGDQQISEQLQVSTQDGGNSSRKTVPLS